LPVFQKFVRSFEDKSIATSCTIVWSRSQQDRKKFTTGLIELAAVMATDKVSRKAAKASKVFSNFI
jgi:hypothetical protein